MSVSQASMNEDYVRWPPFTRLPATVLPRYLEATRTGHYDLSKTELKWRDLHPTLKTLGYRLRLRYDEHWRPSWLGTNIDPTFCEDSIRPIVHNVIDALSADGKLVAIKRVSTAKAEIDIARFLSSAPLRQDRRNHCVEILDVIQDPSSSQISYIVMPYLRPFNDPEFSFVGEIVDFIRQTAEGLDFIHSQRIGHRDCSDANIMMDARALYPEGYHPIRLDYAPNAVFEAVPLARIDHAVRYYFTDFGMSTRFPPGVSPLVVGSKGRDRDVPELSDDVPYDAFKADICILGNTYKKDLFDKFHGLEFLLPLINAMTERDPEKRPSAVRPCFSLISERDYPSLRSRLRLRSETVPERLLRDTVAAAKGGYDTIRRFVGQ